MLPHRWSLTRSWGVVIGLPRLLVGPDTSTTSVLRVPTVLGVTSIAGLIGACTTSRVRLSSSSSYIGRAPALCLLVMVMLLVLELIVIG